MLKPPTRYLLYHIWVNYNDLTATSLEFMVNKGNHPQVALIQELTLLFYRITQLVLLDQLLGGHDANLEGNSIINSWFIQSSARVKSKHAPVLRRAGHNPPTIILVGGLCVWAAWPSPQDVCLFIDGFVLKTPKTPQGSEQEFIETNSRFHCVVLLRPCPTNPKIVILIYLEPCLVYLPRPYSTTPSTYETN